MTTFAVFDNSSIKHQYKVYACNWWGTDSTNKGIYGSNDGLTWEKLTLPTISDIDLNDKKYSAISYINGRYVLVSNDGKFFSTPSFSAPASEWGSVITLNKDTSDNTCAIAKIDDNNIMIYDVVSFGGILKITDFTTLTVINGGSAGFGGNRIYDYCKVEDGKFFIAGGCGILSSVNGTDGWNKSTSTTDHLLPFSKSNDFHVIKYFKNLDILIACGTNDSISDPRHDIWYSKEKGSVGSWKHAIVKNCPNYDAKTLIVDKIVSITNENNKEKLIALCRNNFRTVSNQKLVDVILLESFDGMIWNYTGHTYVRYGGGDDLKTGYIRTAAVFKNRSQDKIIFDDNAKSKIYSCSYSDVITTNSDVQNLGSDVTIDLNDDLSATVSAIAHLLTKFGVTVIDKTA